MHRRHRVPRIEGVSGPELGCQLAEPGRQHCRVLSGELPSRSDLSQVTVRIPQRDRCLPRTAKSSQGHRPRPGTITARQPGIQLREQVLAPGQQRRRLGQTDRLAGDPRAPLHQLADRDPATVRDDGAKPTVPGKPEPG